MMYTRSISEPPDSIVKSGQPVFGDFTPAPKTLDIRKLEQPFSIMPLPAFITNWRIRANLCFTFLTPEFFGTMEIIDAHFFDFAEINIWERSSGKKLSFRSFILLRRRIIPLTIISGICTSLKKKRVFIIRWDYTKGTFSFLCRLKGDTHRADVSFSFSGDLQNEYSLCNTSVIPAPVMRRCAAVHHLSLPLKGSFSLQYRSALQNIPLTRKAQPGAAQSEPDAAKPENWGFFTVRRSYYRLRSHCQSLTVLGTADGVPIRFNLYTSNQDPFDPDLYNENVLFAAGETTPLPPVTITHPYGLNGQWIIQDTESMIDLSFFPVSDTVRKKSILILRTEYHTIYGKCEGTVRDKHGTKFTLKDFCAVAKKQYLRL